ncbi:hypothetical protein GQX73_g3813 [Xylaria multiplex]|uniref:DUF6536 domain-containing protein n=1 Tax=Xylaria multiplex TaxID=323545 RepID=A0A7C8IQG8_9PEZI|nr:hypothetical protein GQX73_g3813 [Xylaria multiplex]
MQILNAPSREEIDAAHREGTWLEIGVTSARNILKVSKFKAYCWLGLLFSSIPIHLLFNSTVFETEHRESKFSLTIATDEFLNGGSFFPPGTSLGTAEAGDPSRYERYQYNNFSLGYYGYGTAGSVKDYADKESEIMKHLASVANLGRTWDRFDVSDCIKQYLSNCHGLDRHRDLVLVVDKPGGWKRNEVWQLLELGVGGFFASGNNPFVNREFTLLTGILAANSPQLLLSASYLAYNNLFTRLQMAQEWAMYGRDYYPLRVTDPQGMQRSTYRLQLPYKYSLPLIALSAFLHFLISNTLYVIVSLGGYLRVGHPHDFDQPGLPEDTAVRLGYSPISLLVVPIVATILITIPIILSFKKLPANMIIVGSNSLSISAACHASSLSRATLGNRARGIPRDGGGISEEVNDDGSTETRQRQSSEYTDVESTSMLHNHDLESILSDNEGVSKSLDVLGRIARSKIRWGVVKMPPEWYTTFTQNDEVEHLSFGVEKDEVSPPEPGRWYA